MAFQFEKLEIPEIVHVVPDVHSDQRGFFYEVYKCPQFESEGIAKTFVQVNHSKSVKGTLRGLHYQKEPKAQGKLITVIEGEIFDVAVDIREGSPTYGKWVSKILNAEQKNMLYIPEGFAHGFCVCSEVAQVIYYCTDVYASELEASLLWNDPTVGVKWPVKDPILSDKDVVSPKLEGVDNNFSYDK